MQGTRGQIRTGGDAAATTLGAAPPTQPPLALFSGVVNVKPDGTADVSFDIPAFAGTVRVMAVAWSKDKVGHASGDVIVRDPVVLTATLPRFLLTGDQGTIRLDLDNVEGPAGEYAISLQTDGPLNVPQKEQKIRLNGKQRSGVSLGVSATAVGIGNVAIRVSGPNGFDMQRSYTLAAKPATQVLTRRTVRPIAKNESITISSDLFADLFGRTRTDSGRAPQRAATSSAVEATRAARRRARNRSANRSLEIVMLSFWRSAARYGASAPAWPAWRRAYTNVACRNRRPAHADRNVSDADRRRADAQADA